MASPGYILGFYKALIWRVGPYGISLGGADTIANGAVSGAVLVNGPRTAGFTAKDPVDLAINGSDVELDQATFGNAKTGPFDLVAAEHNATLNALISGTNINTTLSSRWNTYGHNPNLSVPRTFGMMLISRYQLVRVGINTEDRYHAYIFPRVQLRVKPAGPSFQAEAPPTIRVTPRTTDYTPLGLPYSADGDGLDLGYEDDLGDMYEMDTPNPVSIATWRRNGTATTFDLPFLPVSTVVTAGAAANVATETDGTAAAANLTLSSVNTSTGAVTVSGAGTAGHYIPVMYETRFKPTPA